MDGSLNTEVIHEEDDLRIAHVPGTTARHIMSFSGIGFGPLARQKEEFRRSLAQSESFNTTYVTDKSRGWFNTTKERIVEQIQALTAGCSDVVTLGSSMGGFGAFYFASQVPGCRRAIAFDPQFSVHPKYIPRSDRRWTQYRQQIPEHRINHLLDIPSSDIDYIAFLSARPSLDKRHARHINLVGTPRTWIYLVDGEIHKTAAVIRKAGCLSKLLAMLISQETFDPTAVLNLLMRHGLDARTMPAPVAAIA